jgi:mono/diheme cytochrome c family protein
MKRAGAFQIAVFAMLSAACRRDPDDLRDWRPEDHDHTSSPSTAQVAEAPPDAAPDPSGLSDVTIAAWKQRCVTCHGTVGRGDGPQGAMVRASDLTRPDWQAKVSDEQIAVTIRTGRGSMPGFDLPDSTVKGLVRLIRLLNASGAPGDAEDAAASDAAPPDAAPKRPAQRGVPK